MPVHAKQDLFFRPLTETVRHRVPFTTAQKRLFVPVRHYIVLFYKLVLFKPKKGDQRSNLFSRAEIKLFLLYEARCSRGCCFNLSVIALNLKILAFAK